VHLLQRGLDALVVDELADLVGGALGCLCEADDLADLALELCQFSHGGAPRW
jgi:hypothetical protein